NDIDSIIKGCVDLGIDGVELQNAPAEAYAGAPQAPGRGGFGGGGRAPGAPGAGGPGPARGAGAPGGARGAGRAPLTPEQIEAQRAAAAALKQFRLSASMDKYKEI